MPDWLPWAVNFTACLATGILFRVHAIDERVKEIQDAYNEGIDKLKAADEEALKLNED